MTKQPNILLFLADDLGWKDLTCYGSDYYETSNIDQIAKEGMYFTNACLMDQSDKKGYVQPIKPI